MKRDQSAEYIIYLILGVSVSYHSWIIEQISRTKTARLFILESHWQKPNVSKIIRLKNDRDFRVMILDITSSISNIKKKKERDKNT